MTDIKVFDRWDAKGIAIADPGLQNYISLEPRMVPRTGARYIGRQFHKSRSFIVERLINKVMMNGPEPMEIESTSILRNKV